MCVSGFSVHGANLSAFSTGAVPHAPTLDIQFPLPAGTVLPDYGTGGLYGLASSLRHWLHDRDAAWLPGEVPQASGRW
jgi:hypothetical protein